MSLMRIHQMILLSGYELHTNMRLDRLQELAKHEKKTNTT